MRVTRISVKQLFNTFDHSISLKLGDRITLIHGLNGLGKTTLLRMVKNLCSGRYSELEAVPFVELQLDFDNGTSIAVGKIAEVKIAEERRGKTAKKHGNLNIRRLVQGVEDESYTPPEEIDPSDLTFPLDWIEHRIPGLDRLGSTRWRYLPTREVLNLEEIILRFGDIFPEQFSLSRKNAPIWINELNNSVHVRLIETQRLVTPRVFQRRKGFEEEQGIIPAILMHSEELASKIQRQEREYGALAQSLDRTFPIRYMQQMQKTSLSEEELRTRFLNLEAKRSKLEQAGLLGPEDTGFVMPEEKMDAATCGVLSIYVNDVEKKLGVFDDLAARIDLFRKILNDHFMYKELRIHKEKGLYFISTRTGKELNSTDLSSGEQHEVVLLYELLFHVESNSLIMIDEPEISLHIAWQEEFLKDLEKIIQLSPFDAIIATHSPQIVNDRWNLMVELIGPEEVKK